MQRAALVFFLTLAPGCGASTGVVQPKPPPARRAFKGCRAANRDVDTIDVACPRFQLSISRASATPDRAALDALVHHNLGAEVALGDFSLTVAGAHYPGRRYRLGGQRAGLLVTGAPAEGPLLLTCFNEPPQPARGLVERCSAALTEALSSGLPRGLFEAQ